MSGIKGRSGLKSLVTTNITDGTGSITPDDHRAIENSIADSAMLFGEAEVIVVNMTTTTPPGSPSDRDAYVVGASATGDWSGQDDNIAIWDGSTSPGAWFFVTPTDGMAVWNLADDTQYRWDAGVSPAEWVAKTGGSTVTVEDDGTSLGAFSVMNFTGGTLTDDGGGQVSIPLGGGFSGFRAIQTSGQTFSTITDMNLDSASGSDDAFDADSAVDLANNRADIPAAFNGKHGVFTAGLRCTADIAGGTTIAIQRSQDSGSNWDDIAVQGTDATFFGFMNVSTGPVPLNTGDFWGVRIQANSSLTTTGDFRCFFALTLSS